MKSEEILAEMVVLVIEGSIADAGKSMRSAPCTVFSGVIAAACS